MRTLPAVVLLVLASACAAPRAARVASPPRVEPVATAASTTTAVAPSAPATPPPSRVRALELAAHVKRLVGLKSLRKISRRVPDDCSGLIRWAYLQEDVDLARHADWRGGNAVATFFQLAEDAGAIHQDAPRPGDLVFFRETYDRNRDGKRNDGLTHLGVVDAVLDDGRVTFVHRANSGVKRSVMSLARAGEHRDAEGRVLNDYVRAAGRGYSGKLTGELFVAFASSERMLAHVEQARIALPDDVSAAPRSVTRSPVRSAAHVSTAKQTVAKKPEAKRNKGKARRTATGTQKQTVAPPVPQSEAAEVAEARDGDPPAAPGPSPALQEAFRRVGTQ